IFEMFEIRSQRVTAAAQYSDIIGQFCVLVAIPDKRHQEIYLRFRLQNCLMGAAQIVEMREQGANPLSRRKCLKHVLLDEFGKVADRLHRDGLMEKLQRLFIVDAEPAAESGAIRGE